MTLPAAIGWARVRPSRDKFTPSRTHRMAVASRKPSPGPRPDATPILVRFFGCGEDLRGVNGDYFTVGDSGVEDVPLPAALRRLGPTKLRFSRGAEGWRVTAADNLVIYVNQRRTIGLTDITSGDVIRLSPGGAGMQFLVRQQDATLTRLAGRLAPKRPVAPVEGDGTKPHTAPREVQTKRDAWVKKVGVVFAVVIALALAYLAGSIRSTPNGALAPASAEASE